MTGKNFILQNLIGMLGRDLTNMGDLPVPMFQNLIGMLGSQYQNIIGQTVE